MKLRWFPEAGCRWNTVALVLCLCATMAIMATAWPARDRVSVPIDYDLESDRILVSAATATSPDKTSTTSPLEVTRSHLASYSRTGDTRFLRYAQMTLEGSGGDRSQDPAWALLKARVLQAQHRFEEAATELRVVVARRPQDAEAWLLLSDSLRRSGQLRGARNACLALGMAGSPELAQWCAIQVLQSIGENERAYLAAKALIDSVYQLPAAARSWALSIGADAAAGHGRTKEAISFYELAMQNPTSLALRIAYADLLIAAGRFDSSLNVLRHDGANVSAMVRNLVARRGLNRELEERPLATVRDAFAGIGQAREDSLARDRAVWEFYFNDNPRRALDFALTNWSQQKGSEDYSLLYQVAVAAGDTRTLEALQSWLAAAASELSS